MRHFFIALAAVALASQSSFAQTPNPIDCSEAVTTVEMNYCAERDYERADEKLNAIYQRVVTAIRDSDGQPPYDPRNWESELRNAQRSWIAFRDAECKGLVPMEWGGGTGTAVAVLSCMTELTKARTKAFQDRYVNR
ncbi:MAG: lysozyme inhibitor LprI family protein [Rhodomicrobiaceae bacterium]